MTTPSTAPTPPADTRQQAELLRDFAANGIGFDLLPTTDLRSAMPVPADYLQRIDRSVRNRAAAALASSSPGLPEPPAPTWAPFSSRDTWLMDQHAKYHDQPGNLMHRDECDELRCDFWDASTHTLDALLAAADVAEEGTR